MLQSRQKWNVVKRNLAVGDVVLLADERVPREQWPLGRVVITHSDTAGNVQSVEVKTENSYKTRPISKLCLLEESICDNDEHEDMDNVQEGHEDTDDV